MQKLNLSALKKQPVDTSAPATQSIQTTSIQPQPISITPVSTVETPNNNILTSSQTQPSVPVTEAQTGTMNIPLVQSTEIIKIESTDTHEPKAPVSIPSAREFFPNLGVEFNLLDDLTGPKTSELSSVSSVLTTPEVKDAKVAPIEEEIVCLETNNAVNEEISDLVEGIQDTPVLNLSSQVVDINIGKTQVPEGIVSENQIEAPVSMEVSIDTKVNTIAPENTAIDPQQVAKDLSAQRVGGLSSFTGKKKFVFAASGLVMMVLAGFAVLNFLPTTDIKTSVAEGDVVAQVPVPEKTPEVPSIPKDPVAPETPEVPVAPVVPETPEVPEVPEVATATGAEENSQSGTILSQSGTIAVSNTGTVSAPTGSGASTNPTTSIVTNPVIEAKAFTGTRIINFRTPNGPREKK